MITVWNCAYYVLILIVLQKLPVMLCGLNHEIRRKKCKRFNVPRTISDRATSARTNKLFIYIIFTSYSARCRLEAWQAGSNSADAISSVKKGEHDVYYDGIVREGLDAIMRHVMKIPLGCEM